MKQQIKNVLNTKTRLLVGMAIFVLSFAAVAVTFAAWAPPTAAPPGNNAAEPINVSGTEQTKSGNLGIGTHAPGSDDELRLSSEHPQIKFQDNTSGHTDYWIHNNSDRLYFLPDRDSNGSWESPYPLVLYNSNVGLGTSSPTHPLHVSRNGWKARFSGSDGYIDIGPANSSWAHIYSDRPAFIFNKPLYTTSNAFSSYNGSLLLQDRGTTRAALNSNGLYLYSGWLRTHGATGWYNQTYGGGWRMQDSTWIRSYGSKRIYIDGPNDVSSPTSGPFRVDTGSERLSMGGNEIDTNGRLYLNYNSRGGVYANRHPVVTGVYQHFHSNSSSDNDCPGGYEFLKGASWGQLGITSGGSHNGSYHAHICVRYER